MRVLKYNYRASALLGSERDGQFCGQKRKRSAGVSVSGDDTRTQCARLFIPVALYREFCVLEFSIGLCKPSDAYEVYVGIGIIVF